MNSKPSILLVDDNVDNLTVLKKMLEKMEYRITTATTGLDSMFLISSQAFDLILLDINLPDIDGFEILKQVRGQFSMTELPIIMLTASTRNNDVVSSLSLGANDYVTKPFDFSVIQSRISTQITLKEAEEALRISEERYALASQATKDGLWDCFLDREYLYVSPNWKAIVGLETEETEIKVDLYESLIHPGDYDSYISNMNQLISGEIQRMEFEHRIKYKDKNYRWVITSAVSIRDKSGEAIRVLGSMSDITENKLYSSFAHLPNSILIQDRIEQILKQVKSGRSKRACILFLDLDNFRLINQAYGVLQGDSILLQLVERLSSILEERETLAHAGRDEFIILIEDFDDVQEIQKRMIFFEETIAQPFQNQKDDEIELSASTGIVIIDEKYNSAKRIIQDAESAMNIAKKDMVQHFHFFKDDFYREIVSKLESEKRLKRALRNNELVLYYQPQISVENNRLIGFEALLRWQDPQRGLIMPDEIIPLAEEMGLIIEIGQWTLRETCKQIRAWLDMGIVPCRVAVNLSPIQFKNRDLLKNLANIVKEFDIDAKLLELEITETKAMEDPEQNIIIMNQLKDLGLSFSIDDFGTGYSSLSMLRKFPLSTLKIDKSFIKDIHNNEDALSIVSAIIAMAQRMKFSTIAEGVEMEEQLVILKSAGCKNYQGFLKSKAVCADEATQFLLNIEKAL
ncbi:MAG: EAL domain-containing protein [Spirochaetaceae bacterium]|jgi:diguanylate cyclase (GGDEF)-like protein/PAS domain S-box-containing protein|nr:EAL domain-containing protein [Spirochaetaceae bacterium]